MGVDPARLLRLVRERDADGDRDRPDMRTFSETKVRLSDRRIRELLEDAAED